MLLDPPQLSKGLAGTGIGESDAQHEDAEKADLMNDEKINNKERFEFDVNISYTDRYLKKKKRS